MAFVLPKTLLRVNSYKKLRKFLIENMQILQIFDLGDFFKEVKGEQIVLIAKKKEGQRRTKIKILKDKNEKLEKQKSITISNKVLRKHNNIPILENKKQYKLVNKIKDEGKELRNLSQIFRGISISPNSDHVYTKKRKNSLPIIKGENISKFNFNTTFFLKKTFIKNNQKLVDKTRKNKIILQNIFSCESGIISAIDTKGLPTFDTVTNLVLNDKKITQKYLLGLLNSKLINFYLTYAIFNRSKLTMHTDKSYIGKIPIKNPVKEKQKEIEKIIQKLLKRGIDAKKMENLDNKVYKLYKVNEEEKDIIDRSLKEIMSEKSYGRLNGKKNE